MLDMINAALKLYPGRGAAKLEDGSFRFIDTSTGEFFEATTEEFDAITNEAIADEAFRNSVGEVNKRTKQELYREKSVEEQNEMIMDAILYPNTPKGNTLGIWYNGIKDSVDS